MTGCARMKFVMKLQAIVLLLVVASTRAFAVSLGDELILSALGDPVEVEIEVLQWEDIDLDRVQVAAASREEYDVFKLTWLPVLENLNFNVVGPDLNGKVRVLVSSRDPLDEPFLELLLVLRWPGGSLRREYVLLFDPPGAPAPALTTVVQEPPAPPAVAELVVAEPVAVEPVVAEPVVQEPVTPPPVAEPVVVQVAVAEPVVAEAEAAPAPVEEESVDPPPPAPATVVEEPPVEVVVAVVETPVAPPAPEVAPPAEIAPLPPEAPRVVVVTPEPAAAVAEAPEPAAPPQPAPAPEPQVSVVTAVVEEAADAPAPVVEEEAVPDARTTIAVEVETIAPQPVQALPASDRRMYQVRSGDSLWNIARQFRPAGAGENLYQVLLSIHDLNRSSFINGNISLLKANAVLQVPTVADIESVDAATAEAEFDQRWDEGTQRFEAAQRGEAIPLFAERAPEEEAVPVEPELPPGEEAPVTDADEDALISASETNVPQPLQIAPDTEGSVEPEPDADMPAPAIAVIPDAPAVVEAPPAPAPEPALASAPEPAPTLDPEPANTPAQATVPATSIAPATTPAVATETQTITLSVDTSASAPAPVAEAPRVTTRAIFTAELETEVAAMRARRESAEAIARRLQDTLAQARADRAAEASIFGSKNLLQAGSAVLLFGVLLGGIVFSLRIAGDLRAMRSSFAGVALDLPANRDWSGTSAARAGTIERKEPRMPEMEVVELPFPESQKKPATPSAAGTTPKSPDDLFARMDDIIGADSANPAKNS
jgi:FimV-like protein